MKDALDLKSKSGIHRLITALEERGFLRRMEKRARALEVTRLPENMAETARPATTRSQSQRILPSARHGRSADPRQASPRRAMGDGENAVNVPLVGRIAAGTPIEALQNRIADVPVPSGMIGKGEHYALEVTGDSMINAGILDGDTVIIRRGETAENGQIVVALVDENEVTLKRLRRRGNSIALEPANRLYETRILPADKVKVQGRMIALLRRY
jgi:repressor LexA